MKTLTKTLFASAMAVIFLTSAARTTFAAENSNKRIEKPAPISFNKVLVSGNVNVVLVQRENEGVEIYGGYDDEKTSVKRKGYTLIINSTEFVPVTVIVSVKDLQRIDASGKAVIKTEGKLDVKYLQIFLKDEAIANVKTSTESLYTYIKDDANLKLSGSADSHILANNDVSGLNMDNFAALKTTTEPVKAEMTWSISRSN